MYKLFVAWRFLWTRLVSYVGTVLLALAVALFILVMAVMAGMNEELKGHIRKSSAHVEVLAPAGAGLDDWRGYGARLSEMKHVVGVTPFIMGGAKASSARYSFESIVRGVDLESELAHGALVGYLDEDATFTTDSGLPGVLVGHRIAEKMEIEDGERIRITVQQHDDPDLTGRAVFEVVGSFRTDSFLLDNHLLIPLDQAQRLFGTGGRVTGIGVWLDDYRNAFSVKREIQHSLLNLRDEDKALFNALASEPQSVDEIAARAGMEPSRAAARLSWLEMQGAAREVGRRPGYFVEYTEPQVRTWAEQRPDFFRAMAQEAKIMQVILLVVIVFVAVLILCLLWVLVEQKIREIGIFVALGARAWGVVGIFVLDGLLIGLVGTAAGLVLGVTAATYVDPIANFFRIEVFPYEQFFVSGIPSVIRTSDLVLVSVVSIAASVVASVLPALKAALADPIESLRHE